MRIPLIALILLIPLAQAGGSPIHFERATVLETAFNPPDLTPRTCTGALGPEVFAPVQYAYAGEVPVVLLAGTASGSFRVSWGAIDAADHGGAWVQGSSALDADVDRLCGLAADPVRTDGIEVRIIGTSAYQAAGTYDVAISGDDFLITTASGTHDVRSDHRTHWHDDAGYWNFAPYHHRVVLSAAVTPPHDPCIDDPLGCDPFEPVDVLLYRLGV